jgi:hypothetical protein
MTIDNLKELERAFDWKIDRLAPKSAFEELHKHTLKYISEIELA